MRLPLLFIPFFLGALTLVPRQLDPIVVYGLAALALILLPFTFKQIKQDFKEKRIITLAYLLFLLSAYFSTAFSSKPDQSRLQLLVFLSSFVIFHAGRVFYPIFIQKEKLAIAIVAITSVLSLISLYNTVIMNLVNRQKIGVSFLWVYFGHNHLSSLLIFSLPLIFYFLSTYSTHKKYRPILIFVAALNSIAFIFSFARASLICLAAAILVGGFLLKLIPVKKMFLSLVIVVLTVGLITATANTAKWFKVKKYDLNNTRIVYWQKAWENFQQSPLIGKGLNTFSLNKRDYPQKPLSTIFAHNFFIQMLSDAGILGFLSSLFLIKAALITSFQKVKSLSLQKERLLLTMFWIGLLASTLNALIDFDWQIPAVFFIFWLIAAMF